MLSDTSQEQTDREMLALVAVVEKREPPDAALAAANRASLEERILQGKRAMIFAEWLRERRRAAGVQPIVPS